MLRPQFIASSGKRLQGVIPRPYIPPSLPTMIGVMLSLLDTAAGRTLQYHARPKYSSVRTTCLLDEGVRDQMWLYSERGAMIPCVVGCSRSMETFLVIRMEPMHKERAPTSVTVRDHVVVRVKRRDRGIAKFGWVVGY